MSLDQRIKESLLGKSAVQSGIDKKLCNDIQIILNTTLQFVPAKKPFNHQSELYSSKYICLNKSTMLAKAEDCNGTDSENSPTTSVSLSSHTCDGLPVPQFDLYPLHKLKLTWNAENQLSTGVGLQNLGNTCFMNSVLQVLTNTPPMVNYLTSGEHSRQLCPGTNGFCAICALRSHVKRVFAAVKSNSGAISPTHIAQHIRCVMKSHSHGRQEDAHEFLRYFVDAMQNAALFPYRGRSLDIFTQETSVISRIFGGFHRSQIVCNNCQYVSVIYDPFLDLSLEIKQWNTIEHAMAHYTKMETLSNDDAYNCPRCKRRVSARKILTIHSAPNVLTIHLKRFDHFGKIDRHIGYSDRMNLRPFMTEKQGPPVNYRLYGVVIHNGRSTNSGHYYAFVCNPLGQWHLMDDSRVCPVSNESALKASAYVLFYVRVTTPTATVKPQAKLDIHPVQPPVSATTKQNKICLFKPRPITVENNVKPLQINLKHKVVVTNGSALNNSKLKRQDEDGRSKVEKVSLSKNSQTEFVKSLVPYEDDNTSDETADPPKSVQENAISNLEFDETEILSSPSMDEKTYSISSTGQSETATPSKDSTNEFEEREEEDEEEEEEDDDDDDGDEDEDEVVVVEEEEFEGEEDNANDGDDDDDDEEEQEEEEESFGTVPRGSRTDSSPDVVPASFSSSSKSVNRFFDHSVRKVPFLSNNAQCKEDVHAEKKINSVNGAESSNLCAGKLHYDSDDIFPVKTEEEHSKQHAEKPKRFFTSRYVFFFDLSISSRDVSASSSSSSSRCNSLIKQEQSNSSSSISDNHADLLKHLKSYTGCALGPSVKSWTGEMNSVDRSLADEARKRRLLKEFNEDEEEDEMLLKKKKNKKKLNGVRQHGDGNPFQQLQDRRNGIKGE
ncbi:Ubiquitin carboxyl-terminal hydrolase 36 [Trichinella pseudospiralis]|uniref:Ubiquitin carboxyl-terminal hydrolase n=1 Tax=Trichinella pseudospiralis TaxID=6337 RepID=A0A0V0XXY6_TRIPS|nr:Ubiquitin carboxyl-terminal hydrolase 36 [Trichinella pseudospiralis]